MSGAFIPSLKFQSEGEWKRYLTPFNLSGDQKKEMEMEFPTVLDVPMEPRSVCLIEVKAH